MSEDSQTHQQEFFLRASIYCSRKQFVCPWVAHRDLFTAHFTFNLRGRNIKQTVTLALFAAATEAWGQEIVAIKTALAKVSQISEIKLVTLKKSSLSHMWSGERAIPHMGGRACLIVCVLADEGVQLGQSCCSISHDNKSDPTWLIWQEVAKTTAGIWSNEWLILSFFASLNLLKLTNNL